MLRQDTLTPPSIGNGSERSNRSPSSRSQGLELSQQLQQLEEIIVLDGFKMPLTQRTIINEEQLLSQLLCIEKAIPETIHAAERILQQKEDILAQAQQYAQDKIQAAEQRAAQIADELKIIQQAEMEAQQLRQQAQAEVDALRRRNASEMERARRQAQQEIDSMRQAVQLDCQHIQRDADNYTEQTLTGLEQQLTTLLQVVRNGRQHLQQQGLTKTTTPTRPN